MANIRLLVVDDEAGIRNILAEYAELENYDVTEAANGVEALTSFKNGTFDVVVLDIMMPKMDGWEVCREIRKISRVPIIMLSARGEEYDKLFGFELGVDDYVVKPFSPRELMARIKALIARSKAPTEQSQNHHIIVYEGIHINIDGRNVSRDGVRLSLTPKEFDLLSYLAQNPNRAFSREQLLTSVWGFDFVGDDRTVDTHIKMLREHLGEYRKWIVTVWGIGYKFDPSETL